MLMDPGNKQHEVLRLQHEVTRHTNFGVNNLHLHNLHLHLQGV